MWRYTTFGRMTNDAASSRDDVAVADVLEQGGAQFSQHRRYQWAGNNKGSPLAKSGRGIYRAPICNNNSMNDTLESPNVDCQVFKDDSSMCDCKLCRETKLRQSESYLQSMSLRKMFAPIRHTRYVKFCVLRTYRRFGPCQNIVSNSLSNQHTWKIATHCRYTIAEHCNKALER